MLCGRMDVGTDSLRMTLPGMAMDESMHTVFLVVFQLVAINKIYTLKEMKSSTDLAMGISVASIRTSTLESEIFVPD
jgi:hypothetical protein